jgi:hypothetical protein
MGVVSNGSPDSSDGRFGGRRRVSASPAIAIVLLCGAVGFALGTIYPPDLLFPQRQVATHKAPAPPAERTETTAAPATAMPPPASIPAPSEGSRESTPATPVPTPAAHRAAEAAPTADPAARAADSMQHTPPSPPPLPTILNRTAPDAARVPDEAAPAPAATAPETPASVEEVRPGSRALAVTGERSPRQLEEKSARAPDGDRVNRRADRRSAEKRRAARPKRQQYADTAPPPAPAKPKGLISQIPIVGPVVGLVLPF